MKLQGTSALVTGASRGLGAALSAQLAEKGARVVLVARGKQALQSVAEGIRARGGEVHVLDADVGSKEAVYPLVGAAAALVGPIDLMIHNASTLGPTPLPLLLDTECEDLEQVLQTNLVGPFRLTKAVAGSMVLRRHGLVLQITSDASVSGYPGWGSYGVSKAALDHLGRTWAAELEGTGVRFLTLDPGEMDTQMHRDAMPDADVSSLAKPEDVARKIVGLIEQADTVPSGTRLEIQKWEARS